MKSVHIYIALCHAKLFLKDDESVSDTRRSFRYGKAPTDIE